MTSVRPQPVEELGRRRSHAFGFASFVAALLSVVQAPCWPDDGTAAAAQAAQAEHLVARVTLNSEDKGDLFVRRDASGDFLVRLQDLKAMGFKDPAGAATLLDGEPHVALTSMRGVSFSFDQKKLTLDIVADPRLLPSQTLNADQGRWLRGRPLKGASAFFNYALDHVKSDGAPAATTFSGEFGWNSGSFLFLTDAVSMQPALGERRLIRLNTSLTREDLDDLRRVVVGDFFTPSRDISSGVAMGGLSVSKVFALNPYVVQFPTQTVSGTVALPSDLEVYVDGQRIRVEKLRPGEFELRDILGYGGARSVQVVLRDAFGRVQQLDYSFYFSDQPLKTGLHEYSYSAGALRRRYGTASSDYGPAAAAMFHRYGISDTVTLGLRAEATRGFHNAGPLATVVLGNAGVVNLALASSRLHEARGRAASVAYNYLARRWSTGLALRRDWGDYAALGSPPALSTRRYEASAIVSFNLPGSAALSLSHSTRAFRGARSLAPATPLLPFTSVAGNQRVTTASYSTPLFPGRASLSASLSRIRDRDPRTEVTFRLTVYLDKDHSVAANYQGSRSGRAANVQLIRNQPVGEGLGYVLDASHTSDAATRRWDSRSTVQYNAAPAIVRAEYARHRDRDSAATNEYRASLAGGMAYAGGALALGRPVTGSFGIVKVGELADVAVAVNGQPMGKTGANGTLFIPTLNSYYNNDIVIAPDSIPIDYSIRFTRQRVVPPGHGGALIDFPVTKIQAFSGRIKAAADGTASAVEFSEATITAAGEPLKFPTGRGGEFYLENIGPGAYPGAVLLNGRDCPFTLTVPRSDETFVELGDVICRRAQ